uniref:Matrix extracellular phosphoglycoprotein n=1 Tax=Catagonus wagneri TaxID=51154 RepID=A0A8C3X9U7_9CETA
MRIVCLGLLLLSLTQAAPTFQPQAEKTKHDCAEQRQEEKNKGNIALPHSGKRSQETAPTENTDQEKEKNLSLPGTSENNKSTKAQNLIENRKTMNEDHSIHNKENAHSDLKMVIYPKSTAALFRNHMQHVMEPEAVTELLGEESKENKPRNVLSKILTAVSYAKAPSNIKKNPQRDSQVQNIPLKSRSPHRLQHNMDYLKQLPKVKKVPSDFEGSGYPDLQGRGDNDISPFSGDGPPFKDLPGKGEATSPDREGVDIQTEFSSPSEAETSIPDARGPGYNEIPEKEGHGRGTTGTRDKTAKEANGPDVSLVESGNDIIGSTDFKKLPGKEGNRVDGSGQNAHQGKVEFHYPHAPSKDKRKHGSSDGAESTDYNEIPQNGKGGSRKGPGHSNRSQVTSREKQSFPSKGKGQGQLIPSRGLDNDIKNEIGSHNGPNNEGTMITQSRKNHDVPYRQNNYTRNKGMSQRKGSWGYRKPHSNRRFHPPRKHDSSESSDSGSSSESHGD